MWIKAVPLAMASSSDSTRDRHQAPQSVIGKMEIPQSGLFRNGSSCLSFSSRDSLEISSSFFG
jgi:hypothetical protein